MSIPTGYTKLGLVGYSYKGDYSSTTTYNRYNCVNYQGTTYVALLDNLKGVTPVKGASWDILAQGASSSYVDTKVAELDTKIDANTLSIATLNTDLTKTDAKLTVNSPFSNLSINDDGSDVVLTFTIPNGYGYALHIIRSGDYHLSYWWSDGTTWHNGWTI